MSEWKLVHENAYYQIYLLPIEEVDTEEQFPLNYAVVYTETGRVEGKMPTYLAAVTTVDAFAGELDMRKRMKELQDGASEIVIPDDGELH